MTMWPESENKRIPEGHYSFKINKEPDLKSFTYTDKNGNEREGRKLILYAVGLNDTGQYQVSDGFLPWEPRYDDLCKALNVEHGRDISVAGTLFEADVVHQADKKDPTKAYPRLINIRGLGDAPSANDVPDDDIPF